MTTNEIVEECSDRVMTTASAAKPASGRGSTVASPKQPRIVVFGDSHSHALQRAVEKRIGKGRPVPVSVYRLQKEKNGKQIGDTTFESFLTRIGALGADDVVISMIGGNQHAVLSTIQHPQPFDFFMPGGQPPEPQAGIETVPYRALLETFTSGLRRGDGKSLEALRKSTTAHIVHIIPPPPKSDNAFIEDHHESLFASEGIASLGVSPPALRLKFWTLQTQVLRRICNALGIGIMTPPRVAVRDGFLRPDYYAEDATHANWRYGERLLREIEKRFVSKDDGVRAG